MEWKALVIISIIKLKVMLRNTSTLICKKHITYIRYIICMVCEHLICNVSEYDVLHQVYNFFKLKLLW